MKLNKAAIDLLRAENCISVEDLLKQSGVSRTTFYAGLKGDIDPLPVGKLARTLNAKVTEIIQQED